MGDNRSRLDSKKRCNIMSLSKKEQTLLAKAFVALNKEFRFSGTRDDKPFPGGVIYWFKQDEIHQATHGHGGPAFLTWHRELCNRFERFLRLAEQDVSLHYWDWNEDPKDLFTSEFMGSAKGEAGKPWLDAGFYNPYPSDDHYRGVDSLDIEHQNPADPPISLTRQKKDGTLKEYVEGRGRHLYTDKEIIESKNYLEMRLKLETVHNHAHNYIGGSIGDAHTSFRESIKTISFL
jgi:Common central domain of tyrosinase